ncbi:hypothetical protein ACFQ1Q_05165 [Winogradskyella litorisediminis]|uniref:Uncharacterized protein n=1 Tax=Winogradskyella litorisediminis TaxID=1156618 RepID=A0ABW3N4K5_9FLAO
MSIGKPGGGGGPPQEPVAQQGAHGLPEGQPAHCACTTNARLKITLKIEAIFIFIIRD